VDPSALARFEEMVLPHLDAAYTLARHFVRNDHDAEDVVQDAWLLTIVRHTCYSWLRRHKANARAIEFDETLHGEIRAGEDPEAEMLRGALEEALNQALDELPVEFREVVINLFV